MEMPSHGVPPVVHHYENEASPIAPPPDWGPLFAHGLRQLHRPWFKGLNRTYERNDLTFFHHHCLVCLRRAWLLLAYVRRGPTVLDGQSEGAGMLMDFIFKCLFYFSTHIFEGSAVVRMWMRSVCVCAFIFTLGHMTTIRHHLHDLRFGCTVSVWFLSITFFFFSSISPWSSGPTLEGTCCYVCV